MIKKALLCGINNYKSVTDLSGCVNDVENMKLLLTDIFGYEESNIHPLIDEQVTKSELEREWKWLLNGASPGDTLMFHFSGHGSYIVDVDGDEDGGYDELTCLYDMDFGDPGTFMRDDEWYDLMKRVPDGVRLIVVLDTCHSGTGTRIVELTDERGLALRYAIDPLLSARRLQSTTGQRGFSEEAAAAVMDPRNRGAVRARFLPPPPEVQVRRRTLGAAPRKREAKPMNHLLLAACRDDQTAADAFISNNYHGAFTYHLCKAMRSAPEAGARELLATVIRLLEEGRFAQEPQLEGPEPAVPIFGPRAGVLPVPTTNGGPPATATEHRPLEAGGLDADNKRLLIESYARLLDLIAGQEGRAPASRPIGTRHLVYVHGIGRHTDGYSTDWWNALRPHIGSTFGDGTLQSTRHEVLWSDLVNARLARGPQGDKLREEILEVLRDRQRQATTPVITTPQARRATRGDEIAIDDFLIYMLDDGIRQRIIDRFTAAVRPLLENSNRIDVISHSWGTVVAYEGLREIAAGGAVRGRVANFFTVGSALSIGPVRGSLREANRDGRHPTVVDRWINVDAQSDVVGGMLGDRFEVSVEHLGLQPTGCPWLLLGYNPGCAHGSYFRTDNLAVNHDIFARYINP